MKKKVAGGVGNAYLVGVMQRTTYTAPPARRIADAFQVELSTARLARRIIRGEESIADNPAFPKTNAWIASCYHKPRRIELIFSALNECLDCFGVEAFRSRHGSQYETIADYLNTGDTYSPTLLFRHDTGTFRITTWGDFYERNEKRLGLYTF